MVSGSGGATEEGTAEEAEQEPGREACIDKGQGTSAGVRSASDVGSELVGGGVGKLIAVVVGPSVVVGSAACASVRARPRLGHGLAVALGERCPFSSGPRCRVLARRKGQWTPRRPTPEE